MSNAKIASPVREVTVAGKKHRFVLDLNAFCELEKKTGVSLFKLIKWHDIGINDLRYLLWAGLLADEPTMKLEDLKVTIFELKDLSPVIMESISDVMPQSDASAQAEAEEKKDPSAT